MENGRRIPPLETSQDNVSNEVSSTSSDDCRPGNADGVFEFNILRDTQYRDTNSDGESRPRIQARAHHRSMGNILHQPYPARETSAIRSVQDGMKHLDLSIRSSLNNDTLRIPIVGYEVMEKRARFTIYKLRVEDETSKHSWLVCRRYTDFVRLYSRLKSERPELILPLPGKRWLRDNFDPVFLEERVRDLQVFVNAVISQLKNHPAVREFFCMDEQPLPYSHSWEIQAVYESLEERITALKMELKHRDVVIKRMERQLEHYQSKMSKCPYCNNCSG